MALDGQGPLLIMKGETHFTNLWFTWLAAWDLLYAPSQRQDGTHHSWKNSSMGRTKRDPSDDPPHQNRMSYHFSCRLLCMMYYTYSIHQARERNVLFNDALNTFYLRLYGVRQMVKDHSDSEKGNPLPPHRLLLSINSKGSFICTIPQTG